VKTTGIQQEISLTVIIKLFMHSRERESVKVVPSPDVSAADKFSAYLAKTSRVHFKYDLDKQELPFGSESSPKLANFPLSSKHCHALW